MVIFLRVVFISGLLGYFISKQNIVRCRDCQCYFSDFFSHFFKPPGGFQIRETAGGSGFKGTQNPLEERFLFTKKVRFVTFHRRSIARKNEEKDAAKDREGAF
jgi:hypothetical protein